MAMTKEEAAARRRQKRVEWKAEIQRLQAKQNEQIIRERSGDFNSERISRHNFALLAEVHEKIRSAEFKAWYEATTGELVQDFIDEVVLSPVEYIQRFPKKDRAPQLDWTKQKVESIAQKNPWTNPEIRQYWTEEIQNVTDAKQRRAVLQRLATPRWSNQEKVIAIYRERDGISAETGIPHDVDHVIPIVHPYVCGLHCEFNLRVITQAENRRKSNMFNGWCSRYRKIA